MPAVVDEMRGELDRWFDRLEESLSAEGAPRPAAIDLGRMGDRRAVSGLCQLIGDETAEIAHRVEAARLVGRLQDKSAIPELWKLLPRAPERVADEIAIAIGELFDQKARKPLAEVVRRPDATLRARAGIALGKLGDRRAAPALLEGIGHSDFDVRRRSVHYLGMVGGADGIGPLLDLSVDPRLRYLCTLALGRIGGSTHDERVLPYLLDHLGDDEFADVRGYAAVALGYLGDRRAVPALARVLFEDPEIKWTAETLVRLGAVGREIAGADFARTDPGAGVGPCHRTDDPSVDGYLNATWCEIAAPGARTYLSLRQPEDATLVIRARALATGVAAQPMTAVVNGTPLPAIQLSSKWEEFRLATPSARWQRGRNVIELAVPRPAAGEPAARVGVDHVVLATGRASTN
jgi:hypothetical protein